MITNDRSSTLLKQILLVSTVGNVLRTVWRICLLMLAGNGLKNYSSENLKPFTIIFGKCPSQFICSGKLHLKTFQFSLPKISTRIKLLQWLKSCACTGVSIKVDGLGVHPPTCKTQASNLRPVHECLCTTNTHVTLFAHKNNKAT